MAPLHISFIYSVRLLWKKKWSDVKPTIDVKKITNEIYIKTNDSSIKVLVL